MGIIKVSAKGSAKKLPDKITIDFNFSFKENKYEAVLRKGTDAVKEFKDLLKGIKVNDEPYILEENIFTSGFKIKETYKEIQTNEKNEYGRFIMKKVFDGFVYTQELYIELDYVLEYIEILLSELTDVSTFNKVDISFGIKDMEALIDEAMVDAVKKCKRKAELLAEASGQKLDEVKEINYDVPSNYHEYAANCAKMMSYEESSEAVKNRISLCDVLNPEPIKVSESVICIFEVED